MLKAIFAKHVQEGDIILLSGGERVTVLVTGRHGPPVSVDLLTKEKGSVLLRDYDLVGLGHRPLPRAIAKSDALGAVIGRAGDVLSCSRGELGYTRDIAKHIADLLAAIETYELSKPPEVVKM